MLLHITDTHLFADVAHTLKGVCPCDSFDAVLAHARRRFPVPEAVILGGDMAQDECAATYRLIAAKLSGWQVPFMLTPGNHANIGELDAALIPALRSISAYSDHLRSGNWQVITLNSSAPGMVAGFLADDELVRLEHLLAAGRAEHVLVALHHHPIPVASRWLDEIGLGNRQRLWEVIGRFPQVRALLCGHIHQAFDAGFRGVRVLGTPSTCFQFRPGRDDFALDRLSPGYRWLDLRADGTIRTGIERVSGFIPDDLGNNIPY